MNEHVDTYDADRKHEKHARVDNQDAKRELEHEEVHMKSLNMK